MLILFNTLKIMMMKVRMKLLVLVTRLLVVSCNIIHGNPAII